MQMMMYLTLFAFVVGMAYSATDGGLTGSLNPHFPNNKNPLVAFFEWFGDLGMFCGHLIWAAFPPPYEIQECLHQFDELGSKSLPMVALAGVATGVVLTLWTRDSLIRFGAKSFLPAVVVFSIIRESGPIITALVVSGRAQLADNSRGHCDSGTIPDRRV
jgi:ABC-type transporter Mla maintaining outer membrane lipid asymmetry permease subunit MlaE